MIAAAGAGMAAIDQKSISAEPGFRRVPRKGPEGDIDRLAPVFAPAER